MLRCLMPEKIPVVFVSQLEPGNRCAFLKQKQLCDCNKALGSTIAQQSLLVQFIVITFIGVSLEKL